MKIIVAEHSGYCYGVKRAIQLLDDVIKDNKSVSTLGPIIHNKQVTDVYAEKGVTIVEDLEDLSGSRENLVIRSHGASKSVYDLANSKALTIYDATCPYVKKIQNKVSTYARKGYNIIIVGDAHHPEVIGINGWCDQRATIIKALEDVEALVLNDPICVVCQTTFNLKQWQSISEAIALKFPNAEINNTICLATEQRQNACLDLAKRVDLMVIVGGKHSSNTIKLAKICSTVVQTIHIETKDDLSDFNWQGIETVGIAAGASTPDWVVQSVILKIENEGEVFF